MAGSEIDYPFAAPAIAFGFGLNESSSAGSGITRYSRRNLLPARASFQVAISLRKRELEDGTGPVRGAR